MPPRRTHRRGQTVDYGSFGSQLPAVDRRHASTKVAQLRDFFNEKSGYSRPIPAAQQFPGCLQQDGSSSTPSSLPTIQQAQYQTSYMWSPEELQGIYASSGNPACLNAPSAPALSRSASDNADPNAPVRNAMYRMHQTREQRDLKQWELLSQQQSMMPKEQAGGYARSMQPHLSVQPEDISPKINPYLNYTSPLTPESTPLKSSFDFSMYSNDQTPSKSQSFSIPRTPVTAEMQRAHSLGGMGSSPAHVKHQMPSPANSPSESFAELAAMPSPGSCGVSPQKASVPVSPTGKRQKRAISPPSSATKSAFDVHAETVDEFDLDARVKASVKESSVSSDEIAKYISGPDPADSKWVCLYDGCRCRFGRKENIKSHVQTHLNDRQYQCDQCGKDFVRGHDLKRHLKTHSGRKPFACACGASFARQDALTRHRQRDMCVGGYSGFVPKTTKRGRPPKKNRPDMETRQTKSTRTRQRVAEKTASISPIKVESAHLQEAPVFNSPNYAPSNAMSSFTPPTSPGAAIDDIRSPTQPIESINPQQFEDDMLPLPLSPPQMAHNRYARAIEQFHPNNVGESSQESLYSDPALSPYDMSSPHTAPTLAESSVGSEIDVFMTQDPSEQLQEEFDHLTNPGYSDLTSTYQYMDASDFALTSSIYHDANGKAFPGLGSLDEDYSAQIDSLSNEFLIDP
ncbi:uncharacterized protein N7459_001026 [Penicillium hispanicum]|uniref:uncharacterized protein n=1 Tax=Penicillium hispanicum TaxID=1080232 RepID=UPI002540032F|nr:uncharacterized protein N7459_001026 [Penicillium hispanicum]KAJ5594818.1 hypothetical protein N7459_001026 [Penicillium hispanicum]